MNIRISHFNILQLALVIGFFKNDYKVWTDKLIGFVNEQWSVFPTLKKTLDFQILIYNTLTSIPKSTQYKLVDVYEIYKQDFNKSIEHFLGLGRALHAFFLNTVVYKVLIPNNTYNEALDIIEDAISLDPYRENYWDTKAEILYRMGNIDNALALIFKVYNKNPQFYPDGNKYLYNECGKFLRGNNSNKKANNC